MPASDFQLIRLLVPDCCYQFAYLMANSADPDQLTDLDLHCLQNWVYPSSAGQGLSPRLGLFSQHTFRDNRPTSAISALIILNILGSIELILVSWRIRFSLSLCWGAYQCWETCDLWCHLICWARMQPSWNLSRYNVSFFFLLFNP